VPGTESRTFCLGNFGWTVEENTDDVLKKFVAAVGNLKFGTGRELAAHFGKDPSWVTHTKAKAIAQGLITKNEWIEALKKAKELQRVNAMSAEELEAEEEKDAEELLADEDF
jgi:hypothetical protein